MNHNSIDTLLNDRRDQYPTLNQINAATVLAQNSKGLYVDLNKFYEAFIPSAELNADSTYKNGDKVDVFVLHEDKKLPGVFKASIKKITEARKWEDLDHLKDQKLAAEITRIVKSGVEAKLKTNDIVGFIPFRYIDIKTPVLKGLEQSEWVGKEVQVKIHELDQSKNKIILEQRSISEEQRKAREVQIIESLSMGQELTGNIVAIEKFGMFVDVDGLDVLVPTSEISWGRFRSVSELYKVGETVSGKVFKLDPDKKQVAMSIKQMQAEPWSSLDLEKYQANSKLTAKVVSHAEFGFFVEVEPGVEALVHKSNYDGEQAPPKGSMVNVEVISLDIDKKRMGVSMKTSDNENLATNNQANKKNEQFADSPYTKEEHTKLAEKPAAAVATDDLTIHQNQAEPEARQDNTEKNIDISDANAAKSIIDSSDDTKEVEGKSKEQAPVKEKETQNVN
jgi:ribosomal protein S1